MEKDTVMGELQVEKTEKATEEFIWWEYDDKTCGMLRVNKQTGRCSEYRSYGNPASLKAERKRLRKQGITVSRVKFKAGIRKKQSKERITRYLDRTTEDLQQGFQELQTMIAGYSKDGSSSEILTLLSLILSGYMARIYIKMQNEKTLYFSRAPLVVIRKHSKDLCGGFEHLQRIAQSLIVDTSEDAEFDMFNPTIIPSHNREMWIEQSAHAEWSKDYSGYAFPTVYRDTAVLLHTSFFKENAIREFAERNRWCTVLLFNMKRPNWQRLFAETDLDKIGLPAWNWDVEKVHHLVKLFVFWLSRMKGCEDYHKLVHNWIDMAEYAVHQYNLASVSTGEKLRQGSEWDLACLQITSVAAFVEYLYAADVLNQVSCENLYDEWVNALLPGSRDQVILERSQKAVQENNAAKEQTVIQEFESLLKLILEYGEGEKIYPLSKGGKYQGGPDLDLEQDPWAFLSLMELEKKGPDVPVVKIRFLELLKLAERNNLLQGKWVTQSRLKEILTKAKKDTQMLDYIHTVENVWLNLGGKGASYSGITLIVDKMEFLNENTRKSLTDRIS